ncbi:MAG: hypothetical protein JWN84_2199 [Nocardioides sp.]|nr:hypothetical protein [Nocardioides sp.]
MTGTTIEVAAWAELDQLAAAMGEVGDEMARTTAYAVAWMCRPDGFDTSPVCLLRPLGEVLERIGAAFEEAGRTWRDDWLREQEATSTAARDLRQGDERVRDRSVVLGRVA